MKRRLYIFVYFITIILAWRWPFSGRNQFASNDMCWQPSVYAAFRSWWNCYKKNVGVQGRDNGGVEEIA